MGIWQDLLAEMKAIKHVGRRGLNKLCILLSFRRYQILHIHAEISFTYIFSSSKLGPSNSDH